MSKLIERPKADALETPAAPSPAIDFSDLDLSESLFIGANLTGVIFARANLSGANLTGAVLAGVDFTGADLSGATISWAAWETAITIGANVTGVHWLP